MLKSKNKKHTILLITFILIISSISIMFFTKSDIDITFKKILLIYATFLIGLNVLLFSILKSSFKEKDVIQESIDDVDNTDLKDISNSNIKSINVKDMKLSSRANILTQSNKNINSLYTKIKELSKFNNNIKTYSKENSIKVNKLLESDYAIKQSVNAIDSKTKEITSMIIQLGDIINELDSSIDHLNNLIYDISVENDSNKKGDDLNKKLKEIRDVSSNIKTSSKELIDLIYKVKYEVYNLSTINQTAVNVLDKKDNINEDYLGCFDSILGEVSNIMANLLDLYKIADNNLDIRNTLLKKSNLIPNS
ncbi:hypothetical protein [Tepidibacter mesophilus]|uniref:hypothetical protein n=1 Tax=Tepidibacter mesophilus TaxID=655607 RepID=UPI000C068B9B|nr:hypothetical protein [Tepidibacter mesophilus]